MRIYGSDSIGDGNPNSHDGLGTGVDFSMPDTDVIGVDDKSPDGSGHAADKRRPLSLGSAWSTAMGRWTSPVRTGMGSGSYWQRISSGPSHARQLSTADHQIHQPSGHSRSGLGLRISTILHQTHQAGGSLCDSANRPSGPRNTQEIPDQGDDGDLSLPTRCCLWRPVSGRISQR